MTENLVKPIEQYSEAHERMAATSVFQGVYESFSRRAKEKKVEDPATEFVRERFDGAARSIEPLVARPIRPSDFYNNFLGEAVAEAHEVYKGRSPEVISFRVKRAQDSIIEFTNRASQMVKARETDGLTAKVFFDRMEYLKEGFTFGYNGLVAKTDEPTPSDLTKAIYAHAVHDNFAGHPNVEEQEGGAFLHVNARQPGASDITERYYISPKLNAQPEKVVAIWTDTLDSLGLEDELYYKVAEGLARRYETVIAYASPKTADRMEDAIEEFSRRCPEDLLSDTILPSGIEVSKGVARAPEPDKLNTLLRYRGKDQISYNGLMCALTELSLRRASYDFKQQGKQASEIKPHALSKAAMPYFLQFVKLSGLDPTTMKVAAN